MTVVFRRESPSKTQSYPLCTRSPKATLWCASGGRKQLVLFPVTGFKPCPQKHLVRRDVLEQPLMANFIETSPDVTLQNPLGAVSLGEYGETLFQSISTPAAFAEAIGISVCQNFGYGYECQRVKRLHGAVVHGGNAQGSQFTVGLEDVMSA